MSDFDTSYRKNPAAKALLDSGGRTRTGDPKVRAVRQQVLALYRSLVCEGDTACVVIPLADGINKKVVSDQLAYAESPMNNYGQAKHFFKRFRRRLVPVDGGVEVALAVAHFLSRVDKTKECKEYTEVSAAEYLAARATGYLKHPSYDSAYVFAEVLELNRVWDIPPQDAGLYVDVITSYQYADDEQMKQRIISGTEKKFEFAFDTKPDDPQAPRCRVRRIA